MPLGNEPASIFDGCCEAAARSWLKDYIGGGLVFVSGTAKGKCDTGFQEKGQTVLAGYDYGSLIERTAVRLALDGKFTLRRARDQNSGDST